MAMLTALLEALPQAATSSYALIAYLCLVAALVYITIEQRRLKTIARIIKDIPAKERAALIAKEYSTVPRAGVSAEDWIRAKKINLIFSAFIALLIAGLVVVAIAFKSSEVWHIDQATLIKNLDARWQKREEDLQKQLAEEKDRNSEISHALLSALAAIQEKRADKENAAREYVDVARNSENALSRLDKTFDQKKVEDATAALRSGMPSLAEALFRSAAAHDLSSSAENSYHAGALAEERVDFADAANDYRNAVDLDNKNTKYALAYAHALKLIGKYNAAQAEYERILALASGVKPSNDDLLRNIRTNLALVYALQGKYADAKANYMSLEREFEQNTTLRDTFEYARFMNDSAALYWFLGDFGEAEKRFRN
jgi:hypothetical protein